MIIVGIDPGLNGAIASIEGDTARVWDLPLTQTKSGRRCIDEDALADLIGLDVLGNYCEPHDGIAYLERAQASRQMGSSSAFNYGDGSGLIRGVLAHLRVPRRLVQPVAWKRELGLARKGVRPMGRDDKRDKGRSLKLARKLFPKLKSELELQKHEGRAEALLIAEYGRRELDGKELAA